MNIKRLNLLREFLLTLNNDEFNKVHYTNNPKVKERNGKYFGAGTVCDAIGWAATMFEVYPEEFRETWLTSYPAVDWQKFGRRCFDLTIEEYEWCFSSFWAEAEIDKDSHQRLEAIKRLELIINNGEIPRWFKFILSTSKQAFNFTEVPLFKFNMQLLS